MAELISQVGFPIAMCLLMTWQCFKTKEIVNRNTDAIKAQERELEKKGKHKENENKKRKRIKKNKKRNKE